MCPGKKRMLAVNPVGLEAHEQKLSRATGDPHAVREHFTAAHNRLNRHTHINKEK